MAEVRNKKLVTDDDDPHKDYQVIVRQYDPEKFKCHDIWFCDV